MPSRFKFFIEGSPSVSISVPLSTLQYHKVKKGESPLPRPMAHRAAPISASIALGHASVNAVKATAGAGPLVAPRV